MAQKLVELGVSKTHERVLWLPRPQGPGALLEVLSVLFLERLLGGIQKTCDESVDVGRACALMGGRAKEIGGDVLGHGQVWNGALEEVRVRHEGLPLRGLRKRPASGLKLGRVDLDDGEPLEGQMDALQVLAELVVRMPVLPGAANRVQDPRHLDVLADHGFGRCLRALAGPLSLELGHASIHRQEAALVKGPPASGLDLCRRLLCLLEKSKRGRVGVGNHVLLDKPPDASVKFPALAEVPGRLGGQHDAAHASRAEAQDKDLQCLRVAVGRVGHGGEAEENVKLARPGAGAAQDVMKLTPVPAHE
ncbi:hypothetical protein G6O67_007930 [Ophiocordyceps sinensis]|uniref:Uncharacterized protein n=1 Tax=Ophiocordyceps sinensis TaxID=72228 RepID=A0A8H4LSS2_9HYPO|nr:hypothetical protein G6O67_007930 [Ophiocordyceps sinensis]